MLQETRCWRFGFPEAAAFPLIVNTCELLTGTFEAGGVKPPLWPRLVKIGGEVVNY